MSARVKKTFRKELTEFRKNFKETMEGLTKKEMLSAYDEALIRLLKGDK